MESPRTLRPRKVRELAASNKQDKVESTENTKKRGRKSANVGLNKKSAKPLKKAKRSDGKSTRKTSNRGGKPKVPNLSRITDVSVKKEPGTDHENQVDSLFNSELATSSFQRNANFCQTEDEKPRVRRKRKYEDTKVKLECERAPVKQEANLLTNPGPDRKHTIFMDLVQEIRDEASAAKRKDKRLNCTKKIPNLLPISAIKHKTFSKWLNNYKQPSDWQNGMIVDHAKDKPQDMDMDLWILIQQFQDLIDDILFDQCANELMHAQRSAFTIWVDIGDQLIRTHRFFECYGCNYTTEKLSNLENHLKRQEKSLLVYKCLRCHYRNPSKCAMQMHINAHTFDAKYMMQPIGDELGLYCKKCQMNVRYKSLAPHHEIHHDKVFQTNFTSEFISDWREWFCGK
eukprot:TRINITY_DN8546_c0_g1_i2.p1 TRINITY_DN8546_c0_g1~~TRINITY_DN8546_c0_g1_i2.p1  ORF type:complete len:400 (+),score=73.05 TRINITY_DN8546_c0_g1_i2:178-1377(+)